MDLFKLAIILGMVASAVLQAQSPYATQATPPQPGMAPQPGYVPQQPSYVQQQPTYGQQQPGMVPAHTQGQESITQGGPALQAAFEDTANVAAQWLKLIDDGKYADSWDYASQTFQFTIKKNEWIVAEEKLRQPMGRLLNRQLMQQLPAKDPKGLPAGDYMVLAYKSSFSNRPDVRELVTMVKESDGKWRVLTYQAA